MATMDAAGPVFGRRRDAPAKTVRHIARVSLDLTDKSAFSTAIEICVRWMAERAGGRIPDAASQGTPFDLEDQYQANPCRAVMIDTSDGKVWAARLDEFVDAAPDGSRPSRNWITEMFVQQTVSKMVRFGTQLSCVARPDDRHYELTRPRVVLEVMEKLSAEADGVPVLETPTMIDFNDVGDLESLMYDPGRRLPIVVVSEDDQGAALIEPRRVAWRLSGVVHVVWLRTEGAWELTRTVGKRMSVFGGAVRVYMPGLTEEEEEPARHPLFFNRPGISQMQVLDMLANRLLPLTLREVSHEGSFLRFSDLRRSATIEARPSGDAPGMQALQEESYALQQRVEDLLQDLQSAENLNEDEMQTRLDVEAREEALKSEVEELKRKLSNALRSGPPPADEKQPDRRLSSYDDLEDWAEDVLGDLIVIMPAALKDCRKHGSAKMLGRIESVLLVLRDHYVPARLSKELARLQMAKDALQALGFEDTPCFAQRDEAKSWPQYAVVYRNQKTVLFDHFKNGNGYDNSSQARIYYHWDDENGRLVIGKMPSHLPNSHTN